MDQQLENLFQKIKIEMQKQTESLLEKMDQKIKPVSEENKMLRCEIEKLELKNDILEKEKKKQNILIFRLQEEEESGQQLLLRVKKEINNINVKLEEYEINKIYRIGTKESNVKPRPVVITLTNMWKRNEILKNKKKTSNIYITEDFPKKVLDKRRSLLPLLHEEWSKGNYAFINYDKLVVKPGIMGNEKRKRAPSTPKSLQEIQTPALKLTKVNAFDLMRHKPFSRSQSPSQQS